METWVCREVKAWLRRWRDGGDGDGDGGSGGAGGGAGGGDLVLKKFIGFFLGISEPGIWNFEGFDAF